MKAPPAATSATATPPNAESAATSSAPATEAPSESLEITDHKIGDGATAVDGKKLTVRYVGTLVNGTEFLRSKPEGFAFVLGSGMVIAGWDQGLRGMRVGGQRKLVIPPHLAYGSRSVGAIIPPNAKLVFEVELLKVE
jgi:FKBP-type peptidyl-prolyl cis-trans isomerase